MNNQLPKNSISKKGLSRMPDQLHHWKVYRNPSYLGSFDFQPGERKTLTADYARQESVTGEDGKKQDCLVLHFMERDVLPLILNATNAKVLSSLAHSPYIEQWHGVRMTLATEKVKAFGEITDAVRIQKTAPAPSATAPVIKCTDCQHDIQPHGNMGADAISKATIAKYGTPLCWDCATKRKAAGESGND